MTNTPVNLNTLAYDIAKAMHRKCLIRRHGGMDAALSAGLTPQPSSNDILRVGQILDEILAQGYTIERAGTRMGVPDDPPTNSGKPAKD